MITKQRIRAKGFKKAGFKFDDSGNLLPYDEIDIADWSILRFMYRRGHNAKRDEIPRRKLMKKIALKYFEYSLDDLIENGQTFFLKHRLYIQKIKARPRNVTEDIKWNGNEYVVYLDTEDGVKVEYKLHKTYIEKLYQKVKNNWNYYEQIQILNRND